MVDHIKRQLEKAGVRAPKAPAPTLTCTALPEASRSQESPQIGALPPERPGYILLEQARGLQSEQFPDRFRMVLVGPAIRAQEVADLLKTLPFLTESNPR